MSRVNFQRNFPSRPIGSAGNISFVSQVTHFTGNHELVSDAANIDMGGLAVTEEKGVYFQDGTRKIDMVLAFEEEYKGRGKKAEARNTFMASLLEAGLQLELETEEVRATDKVVVPFGGKLKV